MTPRPNIVYILADDMGYGDVSCCNENSKIHTHHIDRVAAKGMRFTDAHSNSAVCTPTRYGVLTGRYCWRTPRKSWVLVGYSPALIESGRMTVASLLRAQGYATGCVGKWHLGITWPRRDGAPADAEHEALAPHVDYAKPLVNGPTHNGFDYFFGISASLDMPPYVYLENDRVTAAPDRDVAAGEGKGFWRAGAIGPDFDHAEVLPKLTEKAVAFIEERAAGDKPFFLYFPLPAPHTPILPTPEFRGKSGTNAYGDFCLQVDATVGRVMDALERSGAAENTILIFTTDNGCSPMADFEELAAVGHHPSYVFRGHKADIYEGGHRIPFLLRWPARVRAGAVCDEIVCLTDLLATCADLTGAALPDSAGEDSVSNLPVWLEQPLDGPLREATVLHSGDGSFSIRQGRWKLEMCPGSGGWSHPKPGAECEGLPPIQLYDLDADVGERGNVQAKHPEVVERLTQLLTAYVRNGRSTPGAPRPNTGPLWWPQLNWLAEEDMRRKGEVQ